MFASTMPATFELILWPSEVAGDRATASIPHVESVAKIITRKEYGIRWMKYGTATLVAKPGIMLARRTVAFGISGPTRSSAAVRIIT